MRTKNRDALLLAGTIVACVVSGAGGKCLAEDFSDGFDRRSRDLGDWTPYSGPWNVTRPLQLSTEASGAESWIWAGRPPIAPSGDLDADFALGFDATPADEVGRHGGIAFFASAPSWRGDAGWSGYVLDWIDRSSDHGFRLHRYDAGIPTEVVIRADGGRFDPPGRWSLHVHGQRIRLQGDGETFIDVLDGTYRDGYFGFWAYGNGNIMSIDDVAVHWTGRQPAKSAVYFRRGDSNGDGSVQMSDAIHTLSFLFAGGAEPLCSDAADSNDSGAIDLSDAVHTLGFLFLGSPPPPAPGPDCGYDPTPDHLACAAYAACAQPIVPFEVIDGYAITEGDIILGRPGDIPFEIGLAAGGEAAGEEAGGGAGIGIHGEEFRWPNGVIPFVFDGSFPDRQRVTDAMAHWECNTPIRFKTRTSEADFVRFIAGTGCSSWVGRQGGQQDIVLESDCTAGNAIHEIGHAVGLFHEQSRSDRDSFITINWSSIESGRASNFSTRTDADDLGAYDFGSIMHYPLTAFSKDGKATISVNSGVTVPDGVTIGQRTGLSEGDRGAVQRLYFQLRWTLMGNSSQFGNVWDGRPFWIGDFSGDGRDDVLFLAPGVPKWWIGKLGSDELVWDYAGQTDGFAGPVDQKYFTGHFSRTDREQILFYNPGDRNWWLGTYMFDFGNLEWTFAGNTAGFGDVWDGRPFWIGDFSGDGQDDVLFLYNGDKNWWLGSHDGNQLAWRLVSNTTGFAGVDGRPFWHGRFTRPDREQMLFHSPGDSSWWLATDDGAGFQWSHVGDTSGFGRVWDGRPFWIADFTGDGLDDVLFYGLGDRNWWWGSLASGELAWSFVGNTAGFGQVWDGRPFWTGDFDGDSRQEVLFYFPGDHFWWSGEVEQNAGSCGGGMRWDFEGDTSGFGNLTDGRPIWAGKFSRITRDQILFYTPGDGNWWLGSK